MTSGTNRLRTALDAGEVAVALGGHVLDADVVDLLGPTGAHAVWLEAESGPLDWGDIGDLSRAAELWEMAAVVRVPDAAPWRPGRALSLGAHGVVLPQVASVEQAEAFGRSARFAPRGTRGVTLGRRSYGRDDFLSADADDVVTIVQVEDVDRLDHLEALARLDSIDVVFIAPNDLAASMGLIGRGDHPDVVAAVTEGLARIVAAGGIAGTSARATTAADRVAAGAGFLYGAVDSWLRDAAAGFVADVAGAAQRRAR